MRTVLCVALSALTTPGASAVETRMLKIVGHLENAVVLPGNLALTAAMDTGADITSINARDIERYTKDGRERVRFTVDAGGRTMEFDRPLAGIVRVRRADVATVERPVVRLGLCVAGYHKRALVNLADRGNMSEPLLVGRRYMGSAGLVIDSAREFVGEPDCPEIRE